MSTRFNRPSAGFDGNTGLSNYNKYQNDAAAAPKVAISSTKIDGDMNFLISAVNLLDDDITALVSGTIPDGSVTDAKLRDSAGVSVIGRSVNTTGTPTDIAASSNDTVLSRVSDVVGFNTVSTAMIDGNAVTTSKLASNAVTTDKISSNNVTKAKLEQATSYTVLGNTTGSTADVAEVSVLDQDDMSSDSNTALATQQSIKAYVDTQVATKTTVTQQTSSALTVDTGDSGTYAHGQGSTPDIVQGVLICTSASNGGGYAVGDELPISATNGVNTSPSGITIYADTTNIGYKVSSSGTNLIHKTSGAIYSLNGSQDTYWELKLKGVWFS